MRRVVCLVACLLCAGLFPASGTAADPPIAARVRVVKAIEPGEFEVYVRLRYAHEHHAYAVATYCEGLLVRESRRQLDEFSQAPEPPVIEKHLPGCDYLVVGILFGRDGIVARTAAIPVRIVCLPCDADARPGQPSERAGAGLARPRTRRQGIEYDDFR